MNYDELYWDDPIMMIMYNSIYRCIITWEFWSRQNSGMALMCNQQDHCFLLRTKGWTNFHWFIRKLDIVTMFHRLISVFCAICTTEASSQSNGGQMSPHMPGCWFQTWILFSISYMRCHPNPSDFHSIIFQRGRSTTNQILLLTIINHH